MKEKWKDIEGFNGKYQVSNLGRVKSLERIVNGINIAEYNKTRKKTIKQENGIQRKDTQTLYGLLRLLSLQISQRSTVSMFYLKLIG